MMMDCPSLLMATLLTSILMALRPPIGMRLAAIAGAPPKPLGGPRLLWVMRAFWLLFWGVILHVVVERLRLCLVLRPQYRLSVLAHGSLSSLPYRAYPLSCCLLD